MQLCIWELRTFGSTAMAAITALHHLHSSQCHDGVPLSMPACRLQQQELSDSKTALQAQLKAMLSAERELTDSLKDTHASINEQLGALREQVKVRIHTHGCWALGLPSGCGALPSSTSGIL